MKYFDLIPACKSWDLSGMRKILTSVQSKSLSGIKDKTSLFEKVRLFRFYPTSIVLSVPNSRDVITNIGSFGDIHSVDCSTNLMNYTQAEKSWQDRV